MFFQDAPPPGGALLMVRVGMLFRGGFTCWLRVLGSCTVYPKTAATDKIYDGLWTVSSFSEKMCLKFCIIDIFGSFGTIFGRSPSGRPTSTRRSSSLFWRLPPTLCT